MQNKVDNLLRLAGENLRKGGVRTSIEYALKAWDLIPNPKEHWMMYPQTMSIGMANDYADLNEQEEFKQ